MIPRPSLISRDAIHMILAVGGWNAGSNTAAIMHRQIGPIIQNLALGLNPGNLVLMLSIQLTVAVRRLTAGMTEGLDAVSTRLATTSPAEAMKSLLRHATRLHGFVTFPVAVGVIILADPALRVWVAHRLDPATAEQTIHQVKVLTWISMTGMVVRAISDGWLRIIYGAGHVKSYAPLLIGGAILNPVLAIILLAVLPGPLRYTAVSWAFTTMVAIFHGLIAPIQGGRRMGIPLRDFYLPLTRPLVLALGCAPLMWAVDRYLPGGDLVRLVVAAGLYSIVYAAACAMLALEPDERTRLTQAVRRRLAAQRG
jgi:peptidoglycan biosynthesis protein MviN/MurJ (putative lipid II flippase)